MVARGCREWGMGIDCLLGVGFPFGAMEMFWNWIDEAFAQYCESTESH